MRDGRPSKDQRTSSGNDGRNWTGHREDWGSCYPPQHGPDNGVSHYKDNRQQHASDPRLHRVGTQSTPTEHCTSPGPH